MNHPPRLRSLGAASLLLGTFTAIALSGCAAGPAASPATNRTAPVTHLCKPQETVGFSCELTDQRVLSLCGSHDFTQFQGKPEDNPGYAYVVLGTRQGEVQFQFPENPLDYKKHMTQTVSVSAQQNMFVATEGGAFLQFAMGRDVEPDEQAMFVAKKAPPGWWPQGTSDLEPSCARRYNDEHLGSFMTQMVDDPGWAKRPKWAQ
ncbi:MAG: hypothetical protein ACK40L_09865 [Hydrogenophaga sp.]